MDTVLPVIAAAIEPSLAVHEHSSAACAAVPVFSQQVEVISQELMGYIADKWTLVVLEELYARQVMRFSELRKAIPGISQKMLTQTLRQMERNGLVSRKVYPIIPPRVEYKYTDLGRSFGPVICGLWSWVEDNAEKLTAAQTSFEQVRKNLAKIVKV